ncbi:MAG: hypothetical protein PHD36_09465 [Desulfotomaculaceae bacterium]|nr:hypothetical protein [Desulfotomaculaceae bacterium]
MDKINSAYEKALERFKQRKQVPKSEIDKLEYKPAGCAIAAKFLKEKNFDIVAEVKKHPGEFKQYILQGIQETLLKNILLPTNKSTQEKNNKAIEGIFFIKKDNPAVKEILGEMEHLLKYYEQVSTKAYSQFKENFAARIRARIQSMDKSEMGRLEINSEKQLASGKNG